MSASHVSGTMHAFSSGRGRGGPGPSQQASVTPITDLTGTPVAITGVSGFHFEGVVATLTSASSPVNLKGYQVTIDWGDGTRLGKGQIKVAHDGTISIKGEHLFSTAGNFNVTITLTQPGAATTLQIVSTAAISQNSLTGVTINGTAATPFTGAVGTFTIPPTDTTTDPSTFLALINWGDHSRTAGVVTLNSDGSYTVSGTHTYAVAGTYRIGVFVLQTTPFNDDTNEDNGDDHGGENSGGNGNGNSNSAKSLKQFSQGNDDGQEDAFHTAIFSTAIIV